MKVYYDTEFLEDGRTIDLISIGMVAEDGREYYAVNAEADIERIKANDWLVRNVLASLPVTGRKSLDAYVATRPNMNSRPSLLMVDWDRTDSLVKPRWVIANEVREFLIGRPNETRLPELWAWYGAYDHVVLAQLFGRMIDLPSGIPMWTNDLRQEVARLGDPLMPEQESGQHNALADARHVKVMAEFLVAAQKEGGK